MDAHGKAIELRQGLEHAITAGDALRRDRGVYVGTRSYEQLIRRVAKLEEPGQDIDRTGTQRGYGTGDHLIPVDLAAVLADPSLVKRLREIIREELRKAGRS